MSEDPNAVALRGRRYGGIVFGFVLGAVLAAIIMGFLWSSDSALQEQKINELSARISERDATIQTLYSQLPEKKAEGNPPPGGNP